MSLSKARLTQVHQEDLRATLHKALPELITVVPCALGSYYKVNGTPFELMVVRLAPWTDINERKIIFIDRPNGYALYHCFGDIMHLLPDHIVTEFCFHSDLFA
jgi:hypothetical protein